MATTNEYVKYLPIDGATSSMLSPILDFTSKHNFIPNHIASIDGGGSSDFNYPVLAMPDNNQLASEAKIMNSGKKSNKRSVSETKKKFVAARQNWKCGDCQDQLNAWFEVDHKIRLEYGGSNHIDNLVALCRDCHGKKTTIENL
jgi:5-methylcytosine-specific restriction endonuclease McrA